MTFEEWYAECDAWLTAKCGLGVDDLADGPSWDAWNDGLTPAEYGRSRLYEEGFPFG